MVKMRFYYYYYFVAVNVFCHLSSFELRLGKSSVSISLFCRYFVEISLYESLKKFGRKPTVNFVSSFVYAYSPYSQQ